jgi:outer membrane cobalamin receptor
MNKRIFFLKTLLIIFFIALNIYSQQITLEGKVIGENEPLSGANFYLLQSKIGTTSNAYGEFYLSDEIIKLSDTLVVSFIGFKNDTIPLNQFKGPNYYLTIDLIPIKLTYDKSIQVTADRLDLVDKEIPHGSEIVNMVDIERLGSSEIIDYLKTVSAVEIAGNDLSGKHVQIRGSDQDEVNVYIDGVLINNLSIDNVADLSIVSAENIEKLEVLKGSNLTLLGHGAFGGVVNITTRKNSDLSFLIKSKIGQLNTRYYIADLNIPLSNKIIFNYFGQFNKISPEIEYYENERFDVKTKNPSIKVNRQNHNFSMHYLSKKGVLSGKLLSYIFDYDKPFWKSKRQNHILALDYNGEFFGLRQFNISANQLYSNVEYDRQTVGITRYLDTFDTRRSNFKLAKTLDIFDYNIQFSGEYFHDELMMKSKFKDLDNEQTYFDADLYDNRVSMAAVISYGIRNDSTDFQPWKAFLGLRSDILANGRRDFTNSIGISFNRNQGNWQSKPYVSIGKNIKYPTLFENAFLHDIANLSPGDSSINILEPEINTSLELGLISIYTPISSFYENMKVDMSFFSRKIRNKLIKRPFDEVIYESQNGNNTTLGYEASVSLNNILNHFSAHASHLWLSVSNPLLYSYKPKIKFTFQIDYSSSWGGYITSRYFYEGESIAWYYDKQNLFTTQRISPFFDLDISVGYKFNIKDIEINWQAAGYNILDNSGYLYYYLKKRYLHTGISIKY